MGSLSTWHWIIVGLVVVALFGGRGRISGIMGDVADGIRAFRKGVADDTPEAPGATRPVANAARLSAD